MALAQISDPQVQVSLNVGSALPSGVTQVIGGKNINITGATLQPIVNFNVLNANAQDGNIAFYDMSTGTFVCDTAGNLHWDQTNDRLYVKKLKVYTNLNLGDGYTPTITDSVNVTGSMGQVLTSLGGTSGVRWQSPLAGVTSIGGGANIIVSGTSAVPLLSVEVGNAILQNGSIPFYDFTAGKLIATGTTSFYWNNSSSTLYVNNIHPVAYLDTTGSAGSSGQALISTGSGAIWSAQSGVGLVSAGRNIILTGTSASPTINLTQSIEDATSSAGTAYQVLTASTLGGSLQWANCVLSIVAGSGITSSTSSGVATISNTGVTSLIAGSGMDVSASAGAVTITNSGVTSLFAGSGMGVSASAGAVTVTNNGVIYITAGTGISASTVGGTTTISNAGVTSLIAGSGMGVSASAGAVTVTNNGVISITAGTGISASTLGGTTTISNAGVTSLIAGSGISVSNTLGIYTVNATGGVVSVVSGTNMGSCSLVSGTLTINGSVTPIFTSATISGATASSLAFSGTSGGITMSGVSASINMSGSGASINITDIGVGTKLGIASGNLVVTNGYIQSKGLYDVANGTLSGSSAFVLTALGGTLGWKWNQPPYSVYSNRSITTALTTATTGTAQFSMAMTYQLNANSAPISINGSLYFSIAPTPTHPATCVINAVILRNGSALVTLPLTSAPTVSTAQTYNANFSAPITYRDTTGVVGNTYTYTMWVYYVASGSVTAPSLLVNSAVFLSANS